MTRTAEKLPHVIHTDEKTQSFTRISTEKHAYKNIWDYF